MVKAVLYKTVFFFFFFITVFPQTTPEVKEQGKILETIRSEISSLQNALSKLTNEEKQSVDALEKINRKNLLISRLIINLKREESQKEKQINNLTNEITVLESDIKKLQDDYSKYVVWVYKNSGGSLLSYLLNAESINQAVIRYRYLSYITDQREETLTNLRDTKENYLALIDQREKEKDEKRKLAGEKEQEQQNLLVQKQQKENIISELKEDQNSLVKEIDEKRKAEIRIKNLITKLIEDERKRQEKIRLARLNNEEVKVDYNYDDFENFVNLRGRLNWPVTNGRIIRNFGENRNAKLNTVTLNYGVDIVTSKNEDVVAVAEGIISAIEWIPGYGSVLIITHRDNFRTVYGHLSEINVNVGEKVSGGTLLGKVNQSLEGNILHFEIWNERNYQNPETWLAKK